MWGLRQYGLVAVLVASAAFAASRATAAVTGASGASGASGSTASTGTTTATTPTPKVVTCPASVTAVSGPIQWAWSAYGKPSSSGSNVSYSQTIGSGTWNNDKAKGTICSENQGGGEPKRSIVLSVSGSSTVTADVTKAGHPGVEIVLRASVSKSGDPAVCPVGATGRITLFASYFSVHDDEAVMRFSGTCAAWNAAFSGSILHVKISNNGAEIR